MAKRKRLKRVTSPLPDPNEPMIEYPDGLTREIALDICRFIKRGGSPRMACVASGVPMARFERWHARGELMSAKIEKEITTSDMLPDKDAVCYAFYTMIQKALAESANWCAFRLRSSPDWRAHAWRMDKIYSKFLDPPAPKAQEYGEDGRPIPEGGTKVVIYMPENGRSTR